MIAFRCMGCRMRVVAPEAQARAAETWLHDLDARLSRFKAASELSALNADPRSEVPASPLLRRALRAGLWAARASGGLVDPTLATAIEAAGYVGSRDGEAPAPLADALRAAPARRPAAPHPDARWRAIEIDDDAGVIRRPAGLRIDTGGFGKGFAADLVAERLEGSAAVDCGGDLRIVGDAPFAVDIRHPVTGEVIDTAQVAAGAIATSGIDARIWRTADGGYAHHLLDPSTGRPAWTGVVGATALAPTALEAETLAKMAVLAGPLHARPILSRHGGLIVLEDGAVRRFGALRPTVVLVRAA